MNLPEQIDYFGPDHPAPRAVPFEQVGGILRGDYGHIGSLVDLEAALRNLGARRLYVICYEPGHHPLNTFEADYLLVDSGPRIPPLVLNACQALCNDVSVVLVGGPQGRPMLLLNFQGERGGTP